MLETLSNVLKKSFDKIASVVFVDAKLIDEIVKDLQRALLEADVNVKLVKDISDKLRALGKENIKGVEKKELLIKLLHDYLEEILGKQKQEITLKKQTKILLLGLYGSGKCIYPDSNIQLGDGNIIRIRELYEKYKRYFKEEDIEDGKIINISNANLFVPSFNPINAKIENKKATHLWKLNKKELIEVKADNGNDLSIKVTPEHPFFAIKNGQISKIKADELTEEDFIALPKDIGINGVPINISDKVKNLDLFVCLNQREIEIIKKRKTIKEINNNLNNKKNYCWLTSSFKKGNIPIELINLKEFNSLKVKLHKSRKVINFPLFINAEFAEFLGYLMGDGHIGKNYLDIVTEDKEIIERLKYLSKNLFNMDAVVRRDIRTKAMYKIVLSSNTLIKLFGIFNLKPGKKGRELKIPEEILRSDNEIVKSFVRAYFDCDSHAAKNRSIELTSESNILIKQMNLVLNRFGIAQTISKKTINKIDYWRLTIKSKFAEIYADKIGYRIKRKQTRVDNYKIIGNNQGCGNQNIIPLGKSLKEIREKLGFSIGEIQTNAVFSYGRYEESGCISQEHLRKLVNYYKTKRLGRFFQILNSISNKENINKIYSTAVINGLKNFLNKQGIISAKNSQITLTRNGQCYLEQIKQNSAEDLLASLSILSESNIIWAPVREIKRITNDKEEVYDLTVEQNHSFIAEGFIVHNTTTASKLAVYFNKRGHNSIIICLDTHRPAASEQIEQLSKQNNLSFYTEKNEKDTIKIWKNAKDKIKGHDVTIIDTAGRDTLNKDLISEIKKIHDEIKPDYSILIIPADIGQAAKPLASKFKETCNINGVIVTRMDSSAKGGGALTACSETNSPVFFITTGEKINDIESFSPKSFISRLLGMGDLETLLEKVRSVITEKDQKKLEEKLLQGKFTMADFQEQIKAMTNMGSFSKLTSMIPGFSKVKVPEQLLGIQEEKVKKWQHAINSMTKEEKENPELLEKQTSRMQRIAHGSGTSTSDIRAMLKQFKILKEFTKGGAKNMQEGQLSQQQIMKLAKKFGKKIRI